MQKVISVKVPESEEEFVNLFPNVIETFRNSGEELPEYFNDANICDDCEIKEIVELLGQYYLSETEKKSDFWKKMTKTI